MYGYAAQYSLIMTDGDCYKKTGGDPPIPPGEIYARRSSQFSTSTNLTYGIEGMDPEIAFLDKWDIFNKPAWQKWQNML